MKSPKTPPPKGSKRLSNKRREAFCLAYSAGTMSKTGAYRQAYGEDVERPDQGAYQLLSFSEVKDRLDHLISQRLSDDAVTVRKLRDYHERVLDTPPGEVTENHPLCGEYKSGKDGVTVKTVSKENSARELAKMVGANEPENQDIKIRVVIGEDNGGSSPPVVVTSDEDD